jgi:hypothetical protein
MSVVKTALTRLLKCRASLLACADRIHCQTSFGLEPEATYFVTWLKTLAIGSSDP